MNEPEVEQDLMDQISRPASNKTVILFSIGILATAAVLLFARLGHYALWDDEAITAMTARGVWHTGDTSVRVDDHNLLLYRNGLLVRNFEDRYTPPLQFYVFAPFIGLFGDSNFICRLPSACCGLVTVAIILAWMRRLRLSTLVWCGAAILLLTNASFFLFSRQCRYYSITTMLTTAVAYLYIRRDGQFRSDLGLGIALALLLASQYLDYAAVICCVVVDFAVWGRRIRTGPVNWVALILPSLLVGGIVCSIWNPLKQPADPYHAQSWIHDRLFLLYYNWRDLLACDFGLRPLLFICPFLFIKRRSQWLLRAPLALFIFVCAIALAVPTSLSQSHNGEVRYLAPAIPLCIAVTIVAVYGLESLKSSFRNVLLGVSFASIFVEALPGDGTRFMGSTALLYYHELLVPQVEPYTLLINWIDSHVKRDESIYVEPQYMNYPLMLRSSQAIYAWQLTDPPREDFRSLPDIEFWGRVAPDYMIRCGTNNESRLNPIALDMLSQRGIHYQLVDTIHVQWRDYYRPELIWRSFLTIPAKPGEEIYIYRRKS